jgi:hypothetical protein
MSRVRYVCLSDLHAGSQYSLLTHWDPEAGRVQPAQTSPTLGAFAAALRAFLPRVSAPTPTLILLGDALDMAFSRLANTMMVFQRCIGALFPQDGPELFSKEVVFLPGNHDHSLWQAIKEQIQLAAVRENADGYETEFPLVTDLFAPPTHCSPLLTGLFRSMPHLASAEVRVAYPNWGLKGQSSTVILHHGHFVEGMYRAMSYIRRRLSGSDTPMTIERLEAENGGWIDFGWSTLGAGRLMSPDVVTLHSVMQSGRGADDFLGRIAEALAGGICARIPLGGEPKVKNSAVMLCKAILDATIGQGAELERLSYLDVLSPAGLEGLRWYLDEPLRRQIAAEPAEPLTFIFGHTHKPFEDEIVAASYSEPVRVFNSGGWMLDEPRLDTVQGASMILIDEDLNVAALRLFDCPVNGVATPVSVHGTGRHSDLGNPLLAPLRAALESTRGYWQTFSETAARELELRSRVMLEDVYWADQSAAHGRGLL